MRDLHFRANGQELTKIGSFGGLVAGSEGYLRAVFAFSADWDGCAKAASFWIGGQEHAVLIEDGACMIPAQVLRARRFEVSVTGARQGYRIRTGRVSVCQEG